MKKFLFLILCFVWGGQVFAQKSVLNRPFQEVRYEEEYIQLKDSLPLRYFRDRLKYLPLSDNSKWFASVGGEVRQTLEAVRLGYTDQQTDAYLLSRYGLHGAVSYGNTFRVYGELMSGLQYGRDGGARLVDENQLYVLNLFADIRIVEKGDKTLNLKVGRQELQLGSSSLFAIRDGTNVRYTFDGVSATYASKKLKFRSFYAEYVRQDFGILDDESFAGDKKVWGTYLDYDGYGDGGFNLQPFYAGIEELSFYHQTGFPPVKDTRHSFGLRVYGKKKGWDYGTETILQKGKVDHDLTASAHQVAFKVGKTQLVSKKSQLRYGWRGYYTTGDRDSLDTKINTFNPYFPLQSNLRGAFGTLTFPTNLVFTGPSLAWIFDKKLITTLSYDLYWRRSARDGLMNPGGFPSVFPGTAKEKFLGSQGDVTIVYAPYKYLNFVLVYSHFFESEYVRQRPASNSATDFFTMLIIFRY